MKTLNTNEYVVNYFSTGICTLALNKMDIMLKKDKRYYYYPFSYYSH